MIEGEPTRERVDLLAAYGVQRADLLRFLVARTGDRAEAEDVLQELWIRVAAAAGGRPVGDGRSYLFRMAQNLVVDRLRERQRRAHRERLWSVAEARGGERDASPDAERTMLEREELACLTAAIEDLPERARIALELHKFKGRSHAEVAAALGISRSGVEKHMATAIRHLRRALGD